MTYLTVAQMVESRCPILAQLGHIRLYGAACLYPLLEMDLPEGTIARCVRIVQTGPAKGGNFWSVYELSIFGAEQANGR
jgi:hypothetical protein